MREKRQIEMKENERETLGWIWWVAMAVKDGLDFGFGLREKLERASHGESAALSFYHFDQSPSLTLLDHVISLFDLSFLC